jgi:hypothetical protein
MTKSLQDLTRRVQKALATASDSLSGLLRRGSQKALDALSSSMNFINDNIFSLYSNFGGKKTVRSEPKPPRSLLRPNAKPQGDNLRLRAETQQLLNIAFQSKSVDASSDTLDGGKVQTFTYRFDLSSKSNIIFPLGDQNTVEAVMSLKRRADERLDNTLRNAENGYDTVLTAVFNDPERNDYRFSETFENTNITFPAITEKFRRKDIEYDAFLEEVRVMYSVRPSSSGGCRDGKECRQNLQVRGYNLKIVSPKSKNNNCGIVCYIKWKKLNANKTRPDTIRKQVNLPVGEKIHIKDMVHLSKHFQCSHIIYDGNNPSYPVMDSYKNPDHSTDEETIHLILFNEHYMFVENRTPTNTCKACGKKYVNTHTCNEKRRTYYKAKIEKYAKSKYIANHQKYLRHKNKSLKRDELIGFDFETFPDGVSKRHVVYGSSWSDGNDFKKTYGRNSLPEFIEFLKGTYNKTIVSFNGAKYDNFMLLNALSKNGIKPEKIIINNGRILLISFQGNKVIDLAQFIPNTSLEKACKDFQTESRKTEFDHSKMRSWDDVDKFRDEVEPYMVNDVRCLCDLFFTLNRMIYDFEGVNISDFITLPSLAYKLWTFTLQHDWIQLITEPKMYKFIRRGIYGGRCYPLVCETTSKHYDEVATGEMTYEKLMEGVDFTYNADATSLYPASMHGCKVCPVQYPVGDARWSANPQDDYRKGLLGYFHVRWQCPDKLLRVAVLPCKGMAGMKQTLEGGEGVYTNVDLQNAESVGYTFEFMEEAVVWDESSPDVFTTFIAKWFDVKQQNSSAQGNKSLRKLAKLMMNALYGKMLQDVIQDNMTFAYNINDVWNFRRDYAVQEWNMMDGEHGRYLILQGKLHDEDVHASVNKPVQLGGFVLSYSRRIMLHYMKQIDPSLHSAVFSYMDTDSLHIQGWAYKMLKSKGLIMDSETSDLGMLCSDIEDEGLIIHEKNEGSKNYYYEYIDRNNNLFLSENGVMKAKGIPKVDKLGTGKKLLNQSLWQDSVAKRMDFTLFKRVKKPTVKESKMGVSWFEVRTVECSRTWMKNPYARMVRKGNEFYPYGYDFNNISLQ